jgi:hypothetical protein
VYATRVRRLLTAAWLLAITSVPAACRKAPSSVSDPWGPPGLPGLSIDLTPDPNRGELRVEERLIGPRATDVRELRIAEAWAGTYGAASLGEIEVSDRAGTLPLRRFDDRGDIVFSLSRTAVGNDLRIRYLARGASRDGSRFALRLEPDRATGVGHAFLLLPRLDEPVPTHVRFHLEALPAGAEAVTSFGVGTSEETNVSSEELAHSIYLAGRLDIAERAAESSSPTAWRLAILGRSRLSPLATLAFATQALQIANDLFPPPEGNAEAQPVFLLVAEPGLGRAHDGAFLKRALGVWFDEGRALDGQMKIVLLHEILHRVIGDAVRIRGEDGTDVAGFSEGFTSHYARRALFDAGLLSSAAFIDDVMRLEGEDPIDRRERAALSGARYAASLDAKIRSASRGARTLDNVLGGLIEKARIRHTPLAVSDLRELVVAELDANAGEELDRLARGEDSFPLSSDVFGPCFARVETRETSYELGFERASIDGTPAVLRHLVAGSAAERAGLEEGAIVLKAKIPIETDAKREIDLTVASLHGTKHVRFRPERTRRVAHWEARPCTARRSPPG